MLLCEALKERARRPDRQWQEAAGSGVATGRLLRSTVKNRKFTKRPRHAADSGQAGHPEGVWQQNERLTPARRRPRDLTPFPELTILRQKIWFRLQA